MSRFRRRIHCFGNLNSCVGNVVKAPSWIFLETPPDKVTDPAGRDFRKGIHVGIAAEDCSDNVGDCFVAKGLMAGQHFEQNTSESPDVGSLVDGLAARLFGAHIRRSSDNGTAYR